MKKILFCTVASLWFSYFAMNFVSLLTNSPTSWTPFYAGIALSFGALFVLYDRVKGKAFRRYLSVVLSVEVVYVILSFLSQTRPAEVTPSQWQSLHLYVTAVAVIISIMVSGLLYFFGQERKR